MNILLQHIRAQRRVMDRAYHQDVKTLKEIERVSIRQFKNHIKHMERVVREKLEGANLQTQEVTAEVVDDNADNFKNNNVA